MLTHLLSQIEGQETILGYYGPALQVMQIQVEGKWEVGALIMLKQGPDNMEA